ncbi:molybdopterin-dependent oxidoreductase [Halalkalicoccus subterraneus]|uniref:molybdopterin-dependent oxidoreductase n=1 Tax=Halalkalicoccus subterraneus TaxID=2675002 RepID=UPI001FE84C9A|nr:molybdopterin-dependent oxidoreductase [Halalkalicoccus subterraneus]
MPRELRPGDEPALDEEFPNLTVLSRSPENAEVATRSDLDGLLTPAGTHYIRNHYPTPETDAEGWTVSLTGLVEGSGETGADADGPAVGIEELREDYPTESVVHTMECSGNGRTFFEPDAEGHSSWSTVCGSTTGRIPRNWTAWRPRIHTSRWRPTSRATPTSSTNSPNR